METKQIVKLGLGGILLYYGVLRGARGLVVGIHNYSFRSVDLTNGTVSLNLNFIIKNPLFVGLTLNSIRGYIYAQGQKVGYINTDINYYLSGRHTHIVPVVVNLVLGAAFDALLLNIQSGDIRTLTMAFDGKLYVGKVGVPLQINLDYNDFVK